MVVRDGELLPDALRRERTSADDLFAAAREKGLRRIDEVQPAVLETGGRIWFFTGSGETSEGAPERPSVG